MMKSQVDALLHVTEGLLTDARLAYPALKESFSKDLERLRLYCQSRGRGLFTLDLPSLESLLLRGLEEGRLVLEGPLSSAVSKRIQVPRLYAGLWIRVFDKDACLKHEVDVTALAFLRQLLVIGKKLEVGCSFDRKQLVVGAYHDIERVLREPTLGWHSDELGIEQVSSRGTSINSNADGSPRGEDLYDRACDISSLDHGDSSLLLSPSSNDEELRVDTTSEVSMRAWNSRCSLLHLAQAVDGTSVKSLPLFRSKRTDGEVYQNTVDQALLNKVQKVADFISHSLGTYDPLQYSIEVEQETGAIGFKHGPGAVAERLKNWEKSQFPYWPHKLDNAFPFDHCAKNANDPRDRPLNHEVASRLISVPKTSKGPRLIAAEPTSHQWCQQLTWRFLEHAMRKSFGTSFIDFRDQSKSADMVLSASRDRKLATVDLSDASDRLTCWTVERIFRSNPSILFALHAARTRYLRDEIHEDKGFLKLKKFASQGTATTFPVMSIVMLCIALGASLDGDITPQSIWKLRSQVRVFGDDIILPAHGYERLLRIMNLLQLKVNVAKSYVRGHFRESCGTDGFMGYDVTPVKPKCIVADSPASCQAVVDITNNLYLKGYWHASTACFDLLPLRERRRLRIVGPYDTGFRGLTSYSGGYESHLETRWNSSLHRYEVRVWSILDRPQKRPREGYAALLDFFSSKHSHEQARTVSEYAASRKSVLGLLWEPASSRDILLNGVPISGYARTKARTNRVFYSIDWAVQGGKYHPESVQAGSGVFHL